MQTENVTGARLSDTFRYLKDIAYKCTVFRQIHEEAALRCETRNAYMTHSLIVFSFVTSVFTVLNQWTSLPYFSTLFVSVFNTTLAAINSQLNYQENAAKHRIGSEKFLELNQEITEEIIRGGEQVNKNFARHSSKFRLIRKGLPYPPKDLRQLYDKANPDTETVRSGSSVVIGSTAALGVGALGAGTAALGVGALNAGTAALGVGAGALNASTAALSNRGSDRGGPGSDRDGPGSDRGGALSAAVGISDLGISVYSDDRGGSENAGYGVEEDLEDGGGGSESSIGTNRNMATEYKGNREDRLRDYQITRMMKFNT